MKLLPLLCALGCAAGSAPLTTTATPNLAGNWLIQSGTAISAAAGSVWLAGSIQNQGTQVTGIFSASFPCSYGPPFNFTGTVDESGNLSIQSTPLPAVRVQLTVPSNPSSQSTGNVQTTGIECGLAYQSQAVGILVPPASGTFAGPVMESAILPPSGPIAPGATGTVSLSITQAVTPNGNGAFPLAGTVLFNTATCSVTIPVTGTINGLNLTLSSAAGQPNSVSLAATADTSTSELVSSLFFSATPCLVGASSTSFTGTLSLQ